MASRTVVLLLLVLPVSVVAQPVEQPARGREPLAPQRILRILGADGRTVHDEAYRGAFRFLDQNGDSYLTWQEYVVQGRYGTSSVRAAIFRVTDVDRSGYLTVDEYCRNRHVTDEARELLELADENRDGYLSRTEFLAHPLFKKTKLAGRVFDTLDRNRDGWIYAGEYLITWQAWMRSLPADWNVAPLSPERRRQRNQE